MAEARTIARLIHPHIVRVLEFGLEDKTPFSRDGLCSSQHLTTTSSQGRTDAASYCHCLSKADCRCFATGSAQRF